jgi:hypothetical protein
MTTTFGRVSETCAESNIFGVWDKAMFLQQPWPWFAGVQGIERQHCMVCWSSLTADIQLPDCKRNNATIVRTKNSLIRAI